MNAEELDAHNQRRAALRDRLARSRVTLIELSGWLGLSPDHVSRMLSDAGESHPCSPLTFKRALHAIAELARSRCCTGTGDGDEEHATEEQT